MFYADIGSVSSGTMRLQDLIDIFVGELDYLIVCESNSDSPSKERCSRINQILKEVTQRMDQDDYYTSEDAEHDLETLIEGLDEYSPPLCYFGTHQGDGANYGFWPSWDSIESEYIDTIAKIDAGDDWPTDLDTDYVLEVNDHGNCTLFDRRTRIILWEIV